MPLSAMTAASSFALLIRSIPSFVTCISSLLLADGIEGPVLQPLDLELQALEVHDGIPSVVLPLRLLGPIDFKDRDAPSIRPSDFDSQELAPASERESPQEEVVCSDHIRLPFFRKPAPSCVSTRTVPQPARAPASGSVPRDEALYGWNGRRSIKVRTRG